MASCSEDMAGEGGYKDSNRDSMRRRVSVARLSMDMASACVGRLIGH